MNDKVVKALKIALVLVLICVPVSLVTFNMELMVGDELWNFQNISKMINGGKMYVDCNMIITPIFYLIGYCFVKLTSGTILGFRIYNVFIFVGLLFTIFAIFKALKISTLKSFIYMILTMLFIMPYISTGANYNVMAECIYFVGVILVLNREKIKHYSIIQGLMIFACIFTKQNIGLYYLLSVVLLEIITYKKKAFSSLLKEGLVIGICALVSFGLMLVTGCFEGFLNYTVFGMNEFTSGNFSLQETVEVIVLAYLAIALCSYVLGFVVAKADKEIAEPIKILSVFAIFLNVSALPIVNLYHTSFAILLNLVILIYIFEKLLLSKLENKIVLSVLAVIFYLAINSYGIFCGYQASKNIKIEDKDNVYYSAYMKEELYNKLTEVSDYIKQKEKEGIDVICITSDSPLYMTYLKKNHGELDLCFVGNLGKNGKEKVVEKLKSLDNIEILMCKNSYWQEVDELKDYVRENYEYAGLMQDLRIYK